MIRHTVAFTLRHAAGSVAEAEFLKEALALAKIPGVEKFEQLRQVSGKNPYRFGFSMEFAGQNRLCRLQRASGARGLRARPLGTRGRRLSRGRLRGALTGAKTLAIQRVTALAFATACGYEKRASR